MNEPLPRPTQRDLESVENKNGIQFFTQWKVRHPQNADEGGQQIFGR